MRQLAMTIWRSRACPAVALSANVLPTSANGRSVGADTPPAMFANGTVGNGGPYDGIVTLNSAVPYQFTRPTNSGSFDAQRLTEHEIDEVMGLGSGLNISGNDLRPQDLFSWSSAGHRNTSSSGTRYFSINGGVNNIVNFNQDPSGDFGDWLSAACPQAHPYVQNAFNCPGQTSDISAISPEGINLDVIGYDLNQCDSRKHQHSRLCADGQQRDDWRFYCARDRTKEGDYSCHWSRTYSPPYNIPNALADPTLELHNGTGALIGSNNNWQTTVIGGDYHQQPGQRDPKQRACSDSTERVCDHRNAATG